MDLTAREGSSFEVVSPVVRETQATVWTKPHKALVNDN
jgi:hypothetical protein